MYGVIMVSSKERRTVPRSEPSQLVTAPFIPPADGGRNYVTLNVLSLPLYLGFCWYINSLERSFLCQAGFSVILIHRICSRCVRCVKLFVLFVYVRSCILKTWKRESTFWLGRDWFGRNQSNNDVCLSPNQIKYCFKKLYRTYFFT